VPNVYPHHRRQNFGLNGQQRDTSNNPTVSFELQIGDRQDETVKVELSSSDDIPTILRELADQFDGKYNLKDIEQVLQKSWDASRGSSPEDAPPYNGPTPTDVSSWNAECKVELPSGLILEIGPSTIGENAGLGVFVRMSPSSQNGPVLQTQGSAFCGYGPCERITDSLEGLSEYQLQRSFVFMLTDGLEGYVWYDGKLQTVWEAMQASQATGIRSHKLEENEDGELTLFPDRDNPCYLVPPPDQPNPKTLTIQTMGHMCNDLAGGEQRSAEDYSSLSDERNMLVLVPRVVLSDDGILEPQGMPLLTMSKTIVVANVDSPMEVGLRYGHDYWANWN
jgi:hypothetical protein